MIETKKHQILTAAGRAAAGIFLLAALIACSDRLPEGSTQAPEPESASPFRNPTPAATGAAGTNAIAVPAATAAISQEKPLDLSPGVLPGAGVVQPGLMPGHTLIEPR